MNNKFRAGLIITILTSTLLNFPIQSIAAGNVANDDLGPFFDGGKLLAEFRYRYEHVDQSGFINKANAQTARLRAGLQSGEVAHFVLLVEAEGTMRIAGEYNDTINGKLTYPTVSDPENIELNRAQISYTGVPDTVLTFGRQRINVDTQRFIGAVGFRQNEQTFDALRLVNKTIPGLELGYFYANRINRIFGEKSAVGHFDGNIQALNAGYDISGIGKLTGYTYLLDLNQSPTLSTATIGAQFAGNLQFSDGFKLNYAGGYARQTDYANNPKNIGLNYWHAELGLSQNGWMGGVGLEALGGDGTIGFSTPLATLHKFQGFADVFLSTPANGILDAYLRASYQTVITPIDTPWPVMIAATYHDFTRTKGTGWLGSEIDIEATAKISDHFSIGVKYANYNGGGGFAGRSKTWASFDITY